MTIALAASLLAINAYMLRDTLENKERVFSACLVVLMAAGVLLLAAAIIASL